LKYRLFFRSMTKDEMAAILEEFNMKSPLTGHDLTEPIPFNLVSNSCIFISQKVF
jgi:hypothetical protein